MDKLILEIVNDFSQWNGNTFTLAVLVAEAQKEIDRQKLIDATFLEASEII